MRCAGAWGGRDSLGVKLTAAAFRENGELLVAEPYKPARAAGNSRSASAVNDYGAYLIGRAAHRKGAGVSYLVRARLQLANRRIVANAAFHLQNEPVSLARSPVHQPNVIGFGFVVPKLAALIAINAHATGARQAQSDALIGASLYKAFGVRVAMKSPKVV